MSSKDEKILKLLALTFSENDNEANTALRMAQNLMRKAGLTFALMKGQSPGPMTDAAKEAKVDTASLDRIHYIRTKAWSGFNFKFLDSLEAQVQAGRPLTDKQKLALNRIFNAIR